MRENLVSQLIHCFGQVAFLKTNLAEMGLNLNMLDLGLTKYKPLTKEGCNLVF